MDKNTMVRPDTWSAIDGLGRMLPENAQVGAPRERFVGMFFWTWHNLHDNPNSAVNRAWQTPIRGRGTVNMHKVMEESPEAKNDYDHPAWQGMGSGNGIGCGHWNEPIYGYYYSDDEWVLRRQAELLANAGVDAVIFDNTNGEDTWESGYMAVGRVFSRAKKDGVNVPGMAFLLPLHYPYNPQNGENNRKQLRELYEKMYRPGLFQDVWFYWKGKPLVMGYPDALDPNDPLDKEILDFFTFRPCQPSYYTGQIRTPMWGWLSLYPQKVYTSEDGTVEQISVGVAQNTNPYSTVAQKPSVMNGYGIFGRSYTSRGFDSRPDSKLWGANFQEQWDYALQVDPEFVFVTGWNEWISGHCPVRGDVPNGLSDEFDDEHSRDCEPSKGDLKDHYYYQLCANIRRFKGVEASVLSAAAPLTLESSADQWANLGTAFADYRKDLSPRDAQGYYHYQSDTGRNAITLSRVSHDADYIYFEANCQEEITPAQGKNWMRLLIRTRQDGPTWESFHYIVNRNAPGEMATLERSQGGWKWSVAESCEYRLDGKRLVIRVSRAVLGADTPNFRIWFKWCDHNLDGGDIMTLYTDGDASPGGRFMFAYCGE